MIEAVNLEIVSLAGIVAALGLAIGLTVGGLMSNFVAGVVLLMRKPFVVGELIDAQGVMGKVTSIDMFMTTVLTPDNKVCLKVDVFSFLLIRRGFFICLFVCVCLFSKRSLLFLIYHWQRKN